MVSRQFAFFCISGGLAFLIDAGIVQSLVWAGWDPYSARVVSFLCAVTFTFEFNRRITFAGGTARSWPAQWLHYVSTQLGGFALNYGAYAATVYLLEIAQRWPVLAVAVGSIAGLLVNYHSARRWVFGRGG